MPNLTRRGLFGALAAAMTAPVVTAQPVDGASDCFTYGPFEVRWSGWQRHPNQMVYVGYWSALHTQEPDRFHVMTIGGRYTTYHAFSTIDLTFDRTEDAVTAFTLEAAGPALKQRARDALLEHLRGA